VTEGALPPSCYVPPTLPAGSPAPPAPARTRGRPKVANPDAGRAARVLTPALLLPVQVAHSPAEHWLRRLCLAILADALACLEGKGPLRYKGDHGEVARRMREAWEWVESEAEYCFSFSTVCAVLNLDAQAVRRRLRLCLAQGRAAEAIPSPRL
jgi:hypothetical protein